jgi:hypothetical protein
MPGSKECSSAMSRRSPAVPRSMQLRERFSGMGSQSGRLFSPSRVGVGGHLAVLFLVVISKALMPRARSPFQRRLNGTRHIPAPGALVPQSNLVRDRRGDTHDFDHLNRFASRAGRAYSAERAVPTSWSVGPHFEVQRLSAARAPNWACRVKLVRAQVAVIAPSLRERQRA